MNIPLLDLKAQYNALKPDLDRAVLAVLESQHCILGRQGEALEIAIGEYLGGCKALGVSSGTDAILLSLMALGIKPGDEVITTPYTFFATAGCIARLGAIPVFADICESTYNIDPAQIQLKITPKTKAILPVHLFGQSADMDPILKMAKAHSLKVIEDGAQAIGALYKGRNACVLGDVGTLSFYPSKNLGGIGDGGMVVTKDDDLYALMKCLRNHGMQPKYFHPFIGGNFRLDEIQAAALLVKLQYLEGWSEKRRRNAAYYDSRFLGTSVKAPRIMAGNQSIYNQYVITVKNRDGLLNHLNANGIGTEVYYPVPLHLQECFAYLGYKKGDMPVSEKAAETSLALPIYPEMTEEMLKYVADAVLACMETW